METPISGATSKTYTLVTADVGKTLRVRVGFTDSGSFSESLKSAPTAPVMTVPPGPPQKLYAVSRHERLRFYWKPPALNGGSPITHYQISFGLVGEPVGERVQVKASVLQDLPHEYINLPNNKRYQFKVRAVNSNHQGPDAIVRIFTGVNNPARGAPTITGTVGLGPVLTADISYENIKDDDGRPHHSTFTYQWLRVDGVMETDIIGATSKTYTLVTADIGKTIRVRVRFFDNADPPVHESLTSAVPTTEVTLSVDPATVGEGDSATEVTVTATLNGATLSSDTPVVVTVGSGTAVAGTDFVAVADFTITIASNSASNTGTFSLTPIQNSVDEPNKTLDVGGSTTSALTVTGAQVTITDDDTAAVTVSKSAADHHRRRQRQRHLHGEAGHAAERRRDRHAFLQQHRCDAVTDPADLHEQRLGYRADGQGQRRRGR